MHLLKFELNRLLLACPGWGNRCIAEVYSCMRATCALWRLSPMLPFAQHNRTSWKSLNSVLECCSICTPKRGVAPPNGRDAKDGNRESGSCIMFQSPERSDCSEWSKCKTDETGILFRRLELRIPLVKVSLFVHYIRICFLLGYLLMSKYEPFRTYIYISILGSGILLISPSLYCIYNHVICRAMCSSQRKSKRTAGTPVVCSSLCTVSRCT